MNFINNIHYLSKDNEWFQNDLYFAEIVYVSFKFTLVALLLVAGFYQHRTGRKYLGTPFITGRLTESYKPYLDLSCVAENQKS
ncbi:hypothetical protein GCM10028803_16350 [Larkinella knui]